MAGWKDHGGPGDDPGQTAAYNTAFVTNEFDGASIEA
jgi:hypothetical protein